eukprot:m.264962 g.264962  ORF g.264962 m.264962 type:complete len:110 (-) comp26734_c0_seq2:6164-6493(-)
MLSNAPSVLVFVFYSTTFEPELDYYTPRSQPKHVRCDLMYFGKHLLTVANLGIPARSKSGDGVSRGQNEEGAVVRRNRLGGERLGRAAEVLVKPQVTNGERVALDTWDV